MTKHYYWTPEEMQFVHDNFQTMSDAKMARILHRTPAAVCVQRSKAGLVLRVRKPKIILQGAPEPPRAADRPMPAVAPGTVVTAGPGHQLNQETLIALIEAKKQLYGTYNKPVRQEEV